MVIQNAEIATKFYELADLLEIAGENPFRIRAYRNAARVIEELSQNVAELLASGKDLTEFPGIGDAIAKKIKTFVATGDLPQIHQIEKHVPHVLSDLMKIQGLGPKRVKKLYNKLHIKSLHDLKNAIEKNELQKLTGFGEKTQNLIKTGLINLSSFSQRVELATAEPIAKSLKVYLEKNPNVNKVTIAGSFRRRKETIGDLDIIVIAKNGKKVIDYFTHYDAVAEVLSKDETRSTVRLFSGLQVDLRVIPTESYGAALHYFTGSKAHNIAIRKMAVKKHLKVNEYGVFKGNKQIAGKTEQEIYKLFGMSYIEPELRENNGEIEIAKKNKLPKLITLKDIRGDLHSHTNATDGQDNLEAMTKTAQELDYEYLAITDHSQHLTVANGLDKKRLLQQIKTIDKLNNKLNKIVILKSIEVDILENGKLDLPNDVLKELDLTVCSIHSKFNLSIQKQTERVIRAMDNLYFNIFAHPTGRLINKRAAYDIDLEKVMLAAKQGGCFLEINAQRERMDLDDVHCRMAKEIGVKLAISTDAHSTTQLNNMRFGIDQARRGWLEAKDVINTYRLNDLKKLLKRK